MPHFVTDIRLARRAPAHASTHAASRDARARAALAYRRRMIALREHAPDALAARVRRELRVAERPLARTE